VNVLVEENKNSSDQAEALGVREGNSKDNEQHNNQEELLPPRSEVHLNKKTRFKFKIQYPLVRLLTIVFLLFVFLIPGYSIWKQNAKRVDGPATQIKSEQAFEDVEVEISRKGEEKKSGFEKREKPGARARRLHYSRCKGRGNTVSSFDDIF
jgi:cytoskeletal protein RodZ